VADEIGQGESAHGRAPGRVVAVMVGLALLASAGLWTGWKALIYAQGNRQILHSAIGALKQAHAQDRDALQQRLARIERTSTDLQGDFSVVTKRLRITQGEFKKARVEAQQVRAEENQQLAAMGRAVNGQLATKASSDDVRTVRGEVGNVRADLDATKKDLQMARSELGTLIAKNHDDIETLRRLDERDYFEFTLERKRNPEKLGDVTIELRRTYPKKNQCDLVLVVDDKRTEKRSRAINEPIFVYAHGARQPMEVVINLVEKNRVLGYLSVPKVSQPTTSSGGRD
jgi:hypothetical protein